MNLEKHLITPSFKIGEKHNIGFDSPCFIIAEIGQNHQGDFNLAKEMIKQAKNSGADCVKFQKSHLPSKFNYLALQRPYLNENSWGRTYGEHKRHLEFSDEEYLMLQKFSNTLGVLFTASAMDERSLDFLDSINVPFIKIGSGDFHNKPLLEKAAHFHRPLIVSSGMSDMNEVIKAYETIKSEHCNFALLHCVSSYPTPLSHVNLNVIQTYKKIFPDIPIGYSGHELGSDVAVVAVILGAKVIEKHFTLDKSWKGSDHACSLTPQEFKKMVNDIRLYEKTKEIGSLLFQDSIKIALGESEKRFQNSEFECYQKLGKSIVAQLDLDEGEIITPEKICIKVSEPKGIPAKKFDEIIGRVLKRKIKADESILELDLAEC